MANIDAPFGLRPIAKQGSAPGGTIGTTKYKISSGASALFTGDPVKLKADGSIEVKGGAGAITGAISGVFMGCFYTDPTTSKPTFRNNYPDGLAATDAIAFISDDPDQLYIAQQDANDITVADLGNNANMVMAAGSTTTGMSKAEIDSSTAATGNATYMLKILDFYDTPSNDTTAANSVLVVKINNHQLAASTGTAGV